MTVTSDQSMTASPEPETEAPRGDSEMQTDTGANGGLDNNETNSSQKGESNDSENTERQEIPNRDDTFEFALLEVLKQMHTEYKGQRETQTKLLKEIKDLLETSVSLGLARVGKAKDTPVVVID